MIRVGEAAWLLELASNGQVLAAHRALAEDGDASLIDLVPGATTLLVVGRVGEPYDEQRLRAVEASAAGAAEHASLQAARTHRIAVRYDGADLEELARRAAMTPDELAARHAAAEYRVAFVGFQPGFAYLAGLPSDLRAPRRASPRARIPAGSVAIGGAWTGIYPMASPGGWNLIGTADVALFDPDADPPALLQPGDVIRFVSR